MALPSNLRYLDVECQVFVCRAHHPYHRNPEAELEGRGSSGTAIRMKDLQNGGATDGTNPEAANGTKGRRKNKWGTVPIFVRRKWDCPLRKCDDIGVVSPHIESGHRPPGDNISKCLRWSPSGKPIFANAFTTSLASPLFFRR